MQWHLCINPDNLIPFTDHLDIVKGKEETAVSLLITELVTDYYMGSTEFSIDT